MAALADGLPHERFSASVPLIPDFWQKSAGFYRRPQGDWERHTGKAWGCPAIRLRSDHINQMAIPLFVICSVSSNGLVHIAVHLVDHGQVTGIPSERLTPAAMTLMSAQGGLYVVSGQVGSLGFLALSLGVHSRFSGGFYKASALAMVVLSAIALIFLIIAAHNHNLVKLYKIANLYGIPMLVWVVVLAVGGFKGSREL